MESLDLSKFSEIILPKFVKVKQNFDAEKIKDVEAEVRVKIAPFLNDLIGKKIAVGVGSRGVANIAKVTKTVIDSLKKAGAKPFIIPVMGSHGGATPEGQAEILASYGVSKESMGVEINASVDVENIGEYEPGFPIYVAKSALEADGIVIIPRIKPHTCFRGKIESGVCKMLVIGLGKQRGAESVHSQGFGRFAELIPGVGCMIAKKTKVLFAVALVENAYDETCRIEVIPRSDILTLKREIVLQEESKQKMPKILIPKFDVLIIEQIGKNISGDGQDPNITGLYFTKYVSGGPKYQRCAILDVTNESHGNSNGVGVADVTTRKLFDKTDFIKMYTNCFTSTEIAPGKIPMVAATTEDAIKTAVKMCNGIKSGEHKIVWIKNTSEIGEIIVSEPLLKEIKANPNLEIISDVEKMKFDNGEHVFNWD